jgi:hypothetical protein
VSHSKKIAIAALVLASSFLFAIPSRFGNEELHRGQLTKGLANAKQIALACKLYAADHHGAFPNDLNELVPDYLADRGIFSSPLAPKQGQIDYDYFGAGTKDTDSPAEILLRDRYTSKNGGRSVVHFDMTGSTERQ